MPHWSETKPFTPVHALFMFAQRFAAHSCRLSLPSIRSVKSLHSSVTKPLTSPQAPFMSFQTPSAHWPTLPTPLSSQDVKPLKVSVNHLLTPFHTSLMSCHAFSKKLLMLPASPPKNSPTPFQIALTSFHRSSHSVTSSFQPAVTPFQSMPKHSSIAPTAVYARSTSALNTSPQSMLLKISGSLATSFVNMPAAPIKRSFNSVPTLLQSMPSTSASAMLVRSPMAVLIRLPRLPSMVGRFSSR